MVRVPLAPAPPAAANFSVLTCSSPSAIESQSGSLPEVESSTAPLDASGVPSLMVPTNSAACVQEAQPAQRGGWRRGNARADGRRADGLRTARRKPRARRHTCLLAVDLLLRAWQRPVQRRLAREVDVRARLAPAEAHVRRRAEGVAAAAAVRVRTLASHDTEGRASCDPTSTYVRVLVGDTSWAPTLARLCWWNLRIVLSFT